MLYLVEHLARSWNIWLDICSIFVFLDVYCILFLSAMCVIFFFFFFSSRRRHTRSLCDWSSDVCSSDLTCKSASQPSTHRTDMSCMLLLVPVLLSLPMTEMAAGDPVKGQRQFAPCTSDRKSVV